MARQLIGDGQTGKLQGKVEFLLLLECTNKREGFVERVENRVVTQHKNTRHDADEKQSEHLPES